MATRFSPPFTLFLALLAATPAAASRQDSFLERTRTIGFVEYYIQREIDRQSADGVGLVLTADGLLVCLPNVFPEWVPPDQFRDVRVFPAENPLGEGLEGEYLGQDWVTGWHYVRLLDPEQAGTYFTPISEFGQGVPEIGESVWGICMTTGELDYIAYYREGTLSTSQPLPLLTGFSTQEVASPGGPVFLEDGRFAGWAGRSIPMERDMWIGSEFFRANIRNPDETHMFLLAEPFLDEAMKRIPEHPLDHRRPWIGISGTQPLDKETARFMGLTDQGVVIISEVLPGTPAERAGLQDRDLVTHIKGREIPRLKPDSVLQLYFERELLVSPVGEPMQLTVLRDDQEVEVEIIPEAAPKSRKEAQLHFFEGIGLTFREFIAADAIQRREDHRLRKGVVVNFIQPNSPAAAGDVQPGDWVQEIGGQEVAGFAEAVERMQSLLEDESAEEIVLLVRRGNETAVLRVRQ